MGKSSAPPAPDYRGAAEETAASSREANTSQIYANRPTINTPWGQQTWDTSSSIDPSTGQQVTNWTQNVTLDPSQQRALDSQMAISEGRSSAAQDLLGQATGQFQDQIDYSAMPERTGSVDPFSYGGRVKSSMDQTAGDWRQTAQDAVWNAQKPMLDDRRSDVENQLANQGLARGSEAWNREMRGLDDSEARARLLSVDAGRQEAGQLFSQDLQGSNFQNQSVSQQAGLDQSMGSFQNQNRQSAIAEEMQRRGYSLNELNALLTGQQVNMPQNPSNTPQSTAGRAAGVDYSGAAQNQYGAAINSTNVDNANMNSMLGSAAFMFSDERLKEDIETVGLLPSGIRVVYYRYRGLPGRYIGVIAQEVQKIIPSAVICDPSGYLKVNYSKVQ